ncbi:MAG: BMP family ABC transporter substrate-binding protein, partial [Clostridia bacterium]|nr:BMP family ABC transporter substrate-binding protein [Clostridia bacterium]
MLLSLAACGGTGDNSTPAGEDTLKVGFIFLHDENSTYDKNFIDAAKEACKNMNVEMVQKTQIPESNACYDAAVELIDVDGCDIIFADPFGHESFLMKAAEEYPDVEFCHATGTQAHTANLKNFHNAFAHIYEGRYLAGVVAGMKLKAMMDADSTIVPKIGYVGAFTFAEVISGYTSFYLGVKSIVA